MGTPAAYLEEECCSSLHCWLAVSFAEESEFADIEDIGQEFEPPEAVLSAEVGGAWATGNTVFYTLNGGASGSDRWSCNKLSIGTVANLGSSVVDADGDGLLSDEERAAGDQETSRRYSTDLRYDRFLNTRSSLYALGGASVDPFAGYDLRSHEQIGYSRILLSSETTGLILELGLDIAQENYVEGIEPNSATILAGRILVGLTHQFNENVSFTDTVEVYENVQDLVDARVLNSATLTTLSSTFSLKLSHTPLFDNVPVEEYEPLDQKTMVALVTTLL